MTVEAITLRDLRQERGLSLRELETLTGINRAVWSQVERGKLLAEPRHLAALTSALDVPAGAWQIRFQLEALLDEPVAA